MYTMIRTEHSRLRPWPVCLSVLQYAAETSTRRKTTDKLGMGMDFEGGTRLGVGKLKPKAWFKSSL